jgi:parvulin-like peptidyl-prolyl isomerase
VNKTGRLLLTAAAATCVVTATGCTTSPGAAAVVGGDRISAQKLQDAVDRALRDPAAAQQLGPQRAAFVRTELTRLITDDLITRTAAADGVTATNADVDAELNNLAQQTGGQQQLLQAAAAAGVPQAELRHFVTNFVLQQKIGDKLVSGIQVPEAQLQAEYQKNIDTYDQVHAAHILLKTQKQAEQVLAQVRKKPSSFAALAAKLSEDTGSKANGGDLGFQPHSQFVKPFADAIFAARPGSFLVVHTQFGWHVVHVIERRTTTLAQAAPQLKASLLQNQRQALVAAALARTARHIGGVHVNPRYGVWDSAKAQVVPAPAKSELSTPASQSQPQG